MCITPGLLQRTIFSHPVVSSFNPYSKAVMARLRDCRTAAIGMHRYGCDQPGCDYVHWQYHSCGNRHCPSCGGFRKDEWIEHKIADLLPTSYYHVVFTLPHELTALTMRHRTCIFKLLFEASSHALLTLGKDPKYLGAEVGFTSILHTWGQQLAFHPHVHCIVSGGGIHDQSWIPEKRTKHNFLFPRQAMAQIFKGYFMDQLRKLHRQKLFDIEEDAFGKLLKKVGFKKWNVYAKKPFAGPQQVVEYLGRYTHKVAITTHRILDIDSKNVTFRYKDYRDGNKNKVMVLSQEEFVRRFEQHILPKGFVKIRNYGFLKNYNKGKRLRDLRVSMKLPPAPAKIRIPIRQRMLEKYGRDISRCPKCEIGTMVLRETLRPLYQPYKVINQLTDRSDARIGSP